MSEAITNDRPENDLSTAINTCSGKCALLLTELSNFDALTANNDIEREVIEAFHHRIHALLRPGDKAVVLDDQRVGLVLDNLIDINHLTLAGLKFAKLFEEPLCIKNKEVTLDAYGGFLFLARPTGRLSQIDEILSGANAALGVAQAQGRNQPTCVRSMEADEVVANHWQISTRLKDALQAHNLYLDYQPKMDLNTDSVVGAAAFVRWRDRGEILPPEEYLSALPADVTWELTAYTVRQAIRDITDYGLNVPVTLRFDPAALLEPELTGFLKRETNIWGVPAEQLTISVTEASELFDLQSSLDRFSALRDMGFKISIADFGTGFSNITHLREMPIDELSLDPTFSGSVLEYEDNQAFSRSIIDLANSLDITTLSQGIEDARTLELLRSWGCTLGQGFYIGAPVAIDEFTSLAR